MSKVWKFKRFNLYIENDWKDYDRTLALFDLYLLKLTEQPVKLAFCFKVLGIGIIIEYRS